MLASAPSPSDPARRVAARLFGNRIARARGQRNRRAVPISFYSFAWTIGIGLPVLLFARGMFRLVPEWRRYSAVTTSVILALMVTPTVWDPFDRYYVEAAAIVLFCWILGFGKFSYVAIHGILPFCLGFAFIYWALRRRQIRSLES